VNCGHEQRMVKCSEFLGQKLCIPFYRRAIYFIFKNNIVVAVAHIVRTENSEKKYPQEKSLLETRH